MRQQKLKMEILGESSATHSPCEGSHLSNGLVAHRHCQTIQTQVQQAGALAPISSVTLGSLIPIWGLYFILRNGDNSVSSTYFAGLL